MSAVLIFKGEVLRVENSGSNQVWINFDLGFHIWSCQCVKILNKEPLDLKPRDPVTMKIGMNKSVSQVGLPATYKYSGWIVTHKGRSIV